MFADNHSRTTVPENELVSGLRLAVVIIGLTLTLPMFIVGGEVLTGLGAKAGVAAVLTGGLFLGALASVTGYIGAKTRLTTYSIIMAPFGRVGAKILIAILSLTAIAWFGITIGFFGQAVDLTARQTLQLEIPAFVYALAGGALMTGTVLYGFRAMDLLNRLAVPLLALVLFWAGAVLLDAAPLSALWRMEGRPGAAIDSFGLGVTTIIGAVAAASVGMPDVMRFARSGRDAVLACLASFASLSMVLTILAAAPGLMTGSSDFIANLIGLNLGLPALATVIFATWTTNIVNIYAASLALGRLFRGPPDWVLTTGAGALGTAFAVAGATGRFTDILIIISATIPPIAGVYIVHFFFEGRAGERESDPPFKPSAFLAWGLGAGAAYLTSGAFATLAIVPKVTLTTIPAVDGIATAALAYAILKSVAKGIPGKGGKRDPEAGARRN